MRSVLWYLLAVAAAWTLLAAVAAAGWPLTLGVAVTVALAVIAVYSDRPASDEVDE